MDEILRKLLVRYKAGELTENELGKIIETDFITEQMQDCCWDSNRLYRQHRPETIFALGKSNDQLLTICRNLIKNDRPFLITKTNSMQAKYLQTYLPELVYSNISGVVTHLSLPPKKNQVAVITAGTADIPTAEEAAITLEFLGYQVQRFYDRGVAGLQRIFAIKKELDECRVSIVVAGMEGALPTVLAGIFRGPVIAVPTSIGYGASFDGLSALLGMLNSCADKVTVVNIDNGYGAACAADSILQLLE